ncbi:MAG: cytochrome c biogenesis protein CcsA [Coriobacteriia bacterium]|nr:cytochrome c biogenesis protein CcsA [Coriobacteriia bacterium]
MPASPEQTYAELQSLTQTLALIGTPYQALLVAAALLLGLAAVLPAARRWRGWVLGGMTGLLLMGEAVLAWFHFELWQLSAVVDPATGVIAGRVAVPLWVESEKLFVWALAVAVLGSVMRRHREELLPGAMLITAVLAAGAALVGQPFTDPVPGFIGQFTGYLQATSMGGVPAQQAFEGMYNAMQYYYNAWYMWVHPPLLFLSYGAFALSFLATLLMISHRHSAYETTSYRWARFGYLPLTFGMLIGFPWAILAWSGDSWWWSGKVNMSLMMWLLYTAYLHARLYLRRQGMWKTVAGLSLLSFAILVLTYVTTYVVPGAHSYALAAPTQFAALVLEAVRGL